jgi:hypothetical protein
MTTGYVVDLDNGHDGWCVEILRGVTYCGEVFDRRDEQVGIFAVGRSEGHPHDKRCFDCYNANSFALREAARARTGVSA